MRGLAAIVNGLPVVVSWREDGTPLPVIAYTVAAGRIADTTVVVDPAELAAMGLPDSA
ncbi:hypothetical protein [Kitasatospora acidiphila]|uniref:hypothetical protein n=1 Tax=Kitasatospora acidiphila TaxID=2567942 RepID=UPI0015F10635|nr:hypothetical protein [Kitasatospora acidiphila]